jgi:Ca-activated chloride channel family protein
MKAKVHGDRKYRIGQRAVRAIIDAASDDTYVGIRLFGRRQDNDSELIAPIGKLTPERRKELWVLVDQFRPHLRTPMVRALVRARKDFDGLDLPGPKIVVMVGDGMETAGGKIEWVAGAYRGTGIEVVLNVIGFDVQSRARKDQEARDFMRKIAESGGGKYYDARNADELAKALRAATHVSKPTHYEVLEAAGERVIQRAKIGETVKLPPGTYRIRIAGSKTPAKTVRLQAGALVVRSLADVLRGGG